MAGFNHARTIIKAYAKGLDARQDDFNKGIIKLDNPVR